MDVVHLIVWVKVIRGSLPKSSLTSRYSCAGMENGNVTRQKISWMSIVGWTNGLHTFYVATGTCVNYLMHLQFDCNSPST